MSAERVVRYAESGGLQIAYEVVGDGPLDMVFIADSGTGIDVLREHPRMTACFTRLGQIGRVILIDPRGVGLSDPVERFPPLEEWVDDLRAVLDAVGTERAALIGHGYGAQLCLLFAAVHPNRALAVVSINGYARLRRAPDYPAGFPPAAEKTILAAFPVTWGTGEHLVWTSPDTVWSPYDRDWWARGERSSATPRLATVRQSFAFEIDITDVLPAISVPTLVIRSVDDPYIRPGHADYLVANVPGARLVDVGGGHSPMLGAVAEDLTDHIGSFLVGATYRVQSDRALLTVAFTDIVDSTRRAA